MAGVFDYPWDLYHDVYRQNESEVMRDSDPSATLLLAICILIMRIGFYLVEASWVPVHDVQHLMLQNAVDMSAATAAYCLLGYAIAFGRDVHHVIGWDSEVVVGAHDAETALRGLAAVLTVTAVFTAGAAGRLPLAGVALGAALLAGLVAPVLLHWVWAPHGWLTIDDFHFVDQGGSCVVHAAGAAAAFAVLVVLGRRVIKLSDLDPRSVVAGDPAAAAAGLVLVAIGSAALCCYARAFRYLDDVSTRKSPAALNCLAAYAGGFLTCCLVSSVFSGRDRSRDVLMLHAGQGGVAGVVSVAAAPHDYSPAVAMAAGATAGALLGVVCRPWDRSAIEDTTCSLLAHLVGGVVGPVLVPLLEPVAVVRRQQYGAVSVLRRLGSQAGGVLVLIASAFCGALLVCILVKVLGLLRNEWEEADHRRARTLMMRLREMRRKAAPPFCSRLLPMEEGVELRPGLSPPRDPDGLSRQPSTAAQ